MKTSQVEHLTMGITEGIKMEEKSITKIYGQPTDCNITQLKHEFLKITTDVATDLGGDKSGTHWNCYHQGVLHQIFQGGEEFIIPKKPRTLSRYNFKSAYDPRKISGTAQSKNAPV